MVPLGTMESGEKTMSGPDGMRHGVEMVKTLRDAVGDDTDIMLDAWQSWDYDDAVRMTEQLEEHHPRSLEDVAMPNRDGWETLDLLHSTGLRPNVLMMSGVPDVARANSAGAVGFIGKPYLPQEVIEAVEEALGCAGRGRRAI